MEPKLNRLLNDSQALYGLYFHTADFDVFSFFSVCRASQQMEANVLRS